MAWNSSHKPIELTFKLIVLDYLQTLININAFAIKRGELISFVKRYRRALLGLVDAIVGFYDEQMEKAYSKFEEEEESILEDTTKDGYIIKKAEYVARTMRNCRYLFREVNKMLKRNDYLKEMIYTDFSPEDDVTFADELDKRLEKKKKSKKKKSRKKNSEEEVELFEGGDDEMLDDDDFKIAGVDDVDEGPVKYIAEEDDIEFSN